MFEFRGDFTTALIVVLQFFLQVYNGEFLNRNLNNISDPFKTLIDRIEFSDSNVTCVDKEKRACVENGATGNKAKLEEVKRLLTSRKMAVGSDEDDGSEANDTSGDESKLERKETWPIINNKISQCMCVTIPWLRSMCTYIYIYIVFVRPFTEKSKKTEGKHFQIVNCCYC